jgi:hypothetical protein
MRFAFAGLLVAAGLVAFGVTSTRSDDKTGPAANQANSAKPAATSASLRLLLAEKIEIPEKFRGIKVTFKTALNHLEDSVSARKESLPVEIDRQGFADANVDLADLWDMDVGFPLSRRTMTCRQYLDCIVSQLAGAATFVIRDGIVVIAPIDVFYSESLLNRRIDVEFRNKTVSAALQELSDRTALAIAVDPRCDESTRTP